MNAAVLGRHGGFGWHLVNSTGLSHFTAGWVRPDPVPSLRSVDQSGPERHCRGSRRLAVPRMAPQRPRVRNT